MDAHIKKVYVPMTETGFYILLCLRSPNHGYGVVQKVREMTEIPCAVGFGIAEPEQAKEMASLSDGAIVGSAIVKIVAKYGEDCVPYVAEYVKKMKAAVEEAGK